MIAKAFQKENFFRMGMIPQKAFESN